MSAENKYFTWATYDNVEDDSWQFYDCQVILPFGPFKKGDMLAIVYIDFSNCNIRAYLNIEDDAPIYDGMFEINIL